MVRSRSSLTFAAGDGDGGDGPVPSPAATSLLQLQSAHLTHPLRHSSSRESRISGSNRTVAEPWASQTPFLSHGLQSKKQKPGLVARKKHPPHRFGPPVGSESSFPPPAHLKWRASERSVPRNETWFIRMERPIWAIYRRACILMR